MRFCARGVRLVTAGTGALPCLLERRDTGGVAGDLALGGGVVLARAIGCLLRFTPSGTSLDFGSSRCGARRLGGFEGAQLRLHVAAGGGQLAFDRRQATAFGKSPGRSGRGMRAGGKAIPAPEVAFAAAQPLTGLEHGGKASTVGA